jgi:hypothetical protein
MNNKIKFHLLSSIGNFILILSLFTGHEHIINQYIDHLFSIRVEYNFMAIYMISLLLLSWIAPLTIYKFKKHKKHFLIFIIAFLVLIITLITYDILSHIVEYEKYYDGRLDFIIKKIIYVSIKEETLIASLLIGTVIYFNQLFIGKKLLPKRYNEEKDTSIKKMFN